jgi:hypothetical protein
MKKLVLPFIFILGLISCEKEVFPTEVRVVKKGTLNLYTSGINGVRIEDGWYGSSNQSSRTYILYKVGDTFTLSGGWYPTLPPHNSSYHCELKIYVNNTLVQTIRAYAYQPVSYNLTKSN